MGSFLTTTTVINDSSTKFYTMRPGEASNPVFPGTRSSGHYEAISIKTIEGVVVKLYDKSSGTETIRVNGLFITITHGEEIIEVVVTDDNEV